MARAAGWLFGWPWLDPATSWLLRHWYFPLSRLWAAADMAGGSVERFFEAVPLDPLKSPRYRLDERLARFEESRAAAAALDAAWHRAFFHGESASGGAAAPSELAAMEKMRLDSRHRHNVARVEFRPLVTTKTPRVRFDIPSPADVEAVYGPALADPEPLFAAPEPMPQIAVSAGIPTASGRDFWLSFQSPSPRVNDRVFARVHEPADVADPPTVIYGHGVCVEFDHWRGLIDEAETLRASGVRVIRPEAPWHGRRCPRGFYGGERMIAAFPMGSLDLLTAAVREWSVLAHWARTTSRGPLGFAGSSLGAITAQLAAERSRQWPRRLRPDALLLITHCRQLLEAVMEGELMRILGGREAVEAEGWRPEQLEAYLGLLAPGPVPAVTPERIVTVLGRRDVITPFASGLRLVDRWEVPKQNRFTWDRGHFSIPLMMMRDPAPILRFCEILRSAA